MATMTELSPTASKSNHSQDLQVDEKFIRGKVPNFCSVRYGMAYITLLSNVTLMAQNVIINITMVAMVNSTDHQSQVNGSTEGLPVDSFGGPNKAPERLPARVPTYDWSPQIQGIIFGSINYGVMLTLAPSGYLAGWVGTKRVVGASLFGSSFLILCTPLAAEFGVVSLIITRIVQGISQGSGLGVSLHCGKNGSLHMNEADSALLLYQFYDMSSLTLYVSADWVPRAPRLAPFLFAGMPLASFIAILLGGLICQTYGWPLVFYIFGGIGCVCCILWFVLVYDDPVYHPWISTSEKEYIISSLVQEVSSSKKFLPIRAMSKSLPLWSMILCCFSHQWLITILMVYTPTYISSVYNVNIRDNGIFSAIPFFVAGVVGILGGQLADFLLTKSFRLITVRKMATVLGVLPSSALIVALPYLNSSCTTTVALLTISCGLTSLSQSGIYINALDIAPRHSSFLIGASRGFAYIAAILTPAISGYLLSQDPEFGWRNVFLLVFAINILGLIFFLIFGEANVQDWAKERKLTHL